MSTNSSEQFSTNQMLSFKMHGTGPSANGFIKGPAQGARIILHLDMNEATCEQAAKPPSQRPPNQAAKSGRQIRPPN